MVSQTNSHPPTHFCIFCGFWNRISHLVCILLFLIYATFPSSGLKGGVRMWVTDSLLCKFVYKSRQVQTRRSCKKNQEIKNDAKLIASPPLRRMSHSTLENRVATKRERIICLCVVEMKEWRNYWSISESTKSVVSCKFCGVCSLEKSRTLCCKYERSWSGVFKNRVCNYFTNSAKIHRHRTQHGATDKSELENNGPKVW